MILIYMNINEYKDNNFHFINVCDLLCRNFNKERLNILEIE